MVHFQIQPGLPPYGPPALCFPLPDAFREGLVVKFRAADGGSWVGNFAYGYGELSEVRAELGAQTTIVVAKGAGYCVDVDRQLVREMAGPIDYIEYMEDVDLLIVANGLWFEAFGRSGPRWRTRRVSWDGMRSVSSVGGLIVGEAYSPMGPPDWHPFQLDTRTGEVTGGSYSGPE